MESPLTKTVCASDCLQNGIVIMMDGSPCVISEYYQCKPGKGGRSKHVVTVKDLFTRVKKNTKFEEHEDVEIPIIQEHRIYTMLDLDGVNMTLLDEENGVTREDLNLPQELHQSWQDGNDQVHVLKLINQYAVLRLDRL